MRAKIWVLISELAIASSHAWKGASPSSVRYTSISKHVMFTVYARAYTLGRRLR